MCLNDTPDEIEIHSIEQCAVCGASIKDVSTKRHIVRQIIDIPDIKVKIVEHRSEVKICPHCKSRNTAAFIKEIKNTPPNVKYDLYHMSNIWGALQLKVLLKNY